MIGNRCSLRHWFGILLLTVMGSSTLVSAATETIPLKNLPADTRLAIWGDSITEVTPYPCYLEAYLLACMGRKDIKVCTFGHSGETAQGLINRQSDLEAFHPTAVTFCYGMNDTQYSPYTEAKGEAFDKATRANLALLIARGITQRVVVSPSYVDDTFDADNPAAFFGKTDSGGLTAAQGQNITLGRFRDFGRAAAVDTGSAFADVYNRMKDSYALAEKAYGPKYSLGIHVTPNGALMITHEILKALACDGSIGSVEVDMKGGAKVSEGHTVVSAANGVVAIDSTRYPFCYNYDPVNSQGPNSLDSILPYLPFSQELNRFTLKVTNLTAPSADVTWGSETRTFTREQLEKGVNLTEEFEHTPFDATFAKVMAAVVNKQDFEAYMIKFTSNYNGNDNGGNIDANMLAVQAEKDAAVKVLVVPIRHTIAIVPSGQAGAAAPVITGTMAAYPTIGQPFSYQISVLNSPARYAAENLPNGLKLDAGTGQITGTPEEEGTSSVKLAATNATGTGTSCLMLHVGAPLPERPVISSPTTADATLNRPFIYQIVATNKPSHYFATTPSDKGVVAPASSLPPGISYDTQTGLLSGIPTKAGTFPMQVSAMNAAGVTSALVTLTIK